MARFNDVAALARASVRSSLRRQRALVALLAGFITALLVCQAVIGAGVASYAKTAQGSSALNLIELSSASPSATKELDASSLAQMRTMDGVTGVFPWAQTGLSLRDTAAWPDADQNPGAIWGSPIIPGMEPQLKRGKLDADGLSDDQIVLPSTVPGGKLDRLLGTQIAVEYTRVTGPGQGVPAVLVLNVVGIADNTTPGRDGPTPAYLSERRLRQILSAAGGVPAENHPFTSAYIRVKDPDSVPTVQQRLASQGYAVSSVASQMTSLTGLFKALSWASWVCVGLLVLVCLSMGAAIGSSWVAQRTRDVGLLKALGWSARRILSALVIELAGLGVVGAVAGALLGVAAAVATTGAVAARDIELLPVEPWHGPGWETVGLCLLLAPLCVCLGGLRNGLSVLRVDADDALREL